MTTQYILQLNPSVDQRSAKTFVGYNRFEHLQPDALPTQAFKFTDLELAISTARELRADVVDLKTGEVLDENDADVIESNVDMGPDEALRVTMFLAQMVARTERHHAAIDVIGQILAQRGCEHFDPACDDGKLTTLIDIILYS